MNKIENAPKIDGILDDDVWQNAIIAKDFVQFVPYNGKPATEQTEVKMTYDNNAVYFGATLYDSEPDSIFTILSKRDAGFEVNADMLIVSISTFNDGINSNMFAVTAAGVQSDIKGSSGNDDSNWDAVWQSAVNITENGWVVEMAIPYSALRFSKDDKQIWGINFFRGLIRKQEWTSWNWINNEIEGFTNQSGEVTGIYGIKPPLRLSFIPYFSTFAEHYSENKSWDKGIRGGLDLKYGINKSFTLDLMLIPDFSQVQTDDQVLNLSAFEIQYEERRPFFTEGTELFEKGDIFYSKRIGSFPKNGWDVYSDLEDNEEVISNPTETQIINATKVTGRTSKGLGIGAFNAITLKTVAEIRDTISLTEREYITQPLTNYNIFVFDQNLKNNSFVSIINTNMVAPDSKYSANVTASEFLIKNKKQNYEISGIAGLSLINENRENSEYGYKYDLEFAKTGGNIQYSLSQELVDDKFNPNDMGFLRYNNFVESNADISYQILQPYNNILEWRIRFDTEHRMQYNTLNYMQWQIGMNTNVKFKNQWHFGFFFDGIPFGEHDYFEARKDGQVFKRAPTIFGGLYFGSDSRKKLSLNAFMMHEKSTSQYDEKTIRASIEPVWRVNDKLQFAFEFDPSIQKNDLGYVDEVSDIIYFGKRDRKTIVNTIISDFNFNKKISLSLRGRHYWSSAVYNQYYILNNDGTLTENDDYTENENINFNAFNIDMVFKWRFAPGSDILVVWKNAIYNEGDVALNNYWDNFESMFSEPQANLFSIKLLYYLDYQYLNKKLKK